MTEIFLHIATPTGGRIGAALARACARAGVAWSCFLTNDGVCALADPALAAALTRATRALVCADSWHRYMNEAPCPVELGSQVDNSALMGEARRVISL
jgi:hypothetical protein